MIMAECVCTDRDGFGHTCTAKRGQRVGDTFETINGFTVIDATPINGPVNGQYGARLIIAMRTGVAVPCEYVIAYTGPRGAKGWASGNYRYTFAAAVTAYRERGGNA